MVRESWRWRKRGTVFAKLDWTESVGRIAEGYLYGSGWIDPRISGKSSWGSINVTHMMLSAYDFLLILTYYNGIYVSENELIDYKQLLSFILYWSEY